MLLKIFTTVSAYIKLLEPTPVTKWVIWTKVGSNLGHIWVKSVQNYQNQPKHIGRNLRFDQEQHWAEIGDIGQTYGTLGRYCGHWVEIVNIMQKLGTLGRHMGHQADIGQTLNSHWVDFSVFLSKIRLSSFLIQDKTFWFSYPI